METVHSWKTTNSQMLMLIITSVCHNDMSFAFRKVFTSADDIHIPGAIFVPLTSLKWSSDYSISISGKWWFPYLLRPSCRREVHGSKSIHLNFWICILGRDECKLTRKKIMSVALVWQMSTYPNVCLHFDLVWCRSTRTIYDWIFVALWSDEPAVAWPTLIRY